MSDLLTSFFGSILPSWGASGVSSIHDGPIVYHGGLPTRVTCHSAVV
jgi:hypothetical protein